MAKTRFSKSGQPVLGTSLMLEAENDEGPVGWVEAKVVGKLMGQRGSADLVGVIIEWPDGGRERLRWPLECEWRHAS